MGLVRPTYHALVLPKGYILSKDDRRALIQSEWWATILKVPPKSAAKPRWPDNPHWADDPFDPLARNVLWEAVAAIHKTFHAERVRYLYSGRLIDRKEVYVDDSLQDLCNRLCAMHRLGMHLTKK